MTGLSKVICILAVLALLITAIAGCGIADCLSAAAGDKITAAPTDATMAKLGARDPFGRYSPEITVTTAYRVTAGTEYVDGNTLEENEWTKLYKKYGINIKSAWAVDSGQYDNKMNMAIASGDIPDIMPMLMGSHINKLIRSGMLVDLAPYVNEYQTPAVKQILYGENQVQGMDIEGKLYYIPTNVQDPLMYNTKGLWVRKDWLDKKGLTIPKTLDDFLKVCDAFTNGDPDGNGKKDTYGVGLPGKDNLLYNWGGVDEFAQMWHVNPGVWWDNALFYEKDGSGSIIWSGSKHGMKDCLAAMADMYKKGYISKDFATSDSGGKLKQDITSGNCGMFFGTGWGMSFWLLADMKKKDPAAEWYVTSIPTADGIPVKIYGYQRASVFWGVSANCKYPEVAVKMLNIYQDMYGKATDKVIADTYFNAKKGYPLINCVSADTMKSYYSSIKAALASKDTAGLNATEKNYYDEVIKYETGKDPAAWPFWHNYAGVPGTCLYHMYDEQKTDMIQNNVFMSVGTDLMASLVPQFRKMAEETITRIIYGQAPVSEWDTALENWSKLGGDEILKEVQSLAR